MARVQNTPLVESSCEDYLSAINRRGNQMNIRQKISQIIAYNRTVRELNSLSNIQLRDLGITRDDIRNVARTAVN